MLERILIKQRALIMTHVIVDAFIGWLEKKPTPYDAGLLD